MATDYVKAVLSKFDETQRGTRTKQLMWWANQFAGLTVATVNRYIAVLSHAMAFAVKERRLIDRNPVGDIRREKEPRGRTRFLTR